MWESQRNGLAVALESLNARDPNSPAIRNQEGRRYTSFDVRGGTRTPRRPAESLRKALSLALEWFGPARSSRDD